MKSEKQFSNQGNSQGLAQGNMGAPEHLLSPLSKQSLTLNSVAQILDSLPPGQIVRYFAHNGLEALFEQQEEMTEDSYGVDATSLELNTTLNASIDAEMESDLYSIELEEGENYAFTVTSDELSSPYLVLRDSDGERISSDFQEGDETSATFSFTAPQSGTFYLDLSDLEDQASGTYNISVAVAEESTGDDSDAEAGEDTSENGSDAETGEDTAENGSDAETGEDTTAEEDGSTNQDGSEAISGEESDTEETAAEAEDDTANQDAADVVTEDSAEVTDEVIAEEDAVLETDEDAVVIELSENDQSADILTTSFLAVSNTAEGSLDFAGDVDWFATSFAAGSTYDVSFESGTLEGGNLAIYDAEGELALALSSEDEDGVLSFTAEESGTYFIGVSDANAEATGDYLVGVQQQMPEEAIA